MREHVVVYREPGRYAGWPANYGIWAWDDRIIVGFTVGHMRAVDQFHPRDTSKPFVAMQATSRDDGRTWETQPTPCADPWLSADEHMPDVLPPPPQRAAQFDAQLRGCPGDVNFTHPDFALMCARTGLTAGARSSFYLSTDRCKSWQGPYRLPMFDQLGIAARTDYVVTGSRECTLMLTATKPDGGEGRVLCARTTDGGASFRFVAWIDETPRATRSCRPPLRFATIIFSRRFAGRPADVIGSTCSNRATAANRGD